MCAFDAVSFDPVTFDVCAPPAGGAVSYAGGSHVDERMWRKQDPPPEIDPELAVILAAYVEYYE